MQPNPESEDCPITQRHNNLTIRTLQREVSPSPGGCDISKVDFAQRKGARNEAAILGGDDPSATRNPGISDLRELVRIEIDALDRARCAVKIRHTKFSGQIF